MGLHLLRCGCSDVAAVADAGALQELARGLQALARRQAASLAAARAALAEA